MQPANEQTREDIQGKIARGESMNYMLGGEVSKGKVHHVAGRYFLKSMPAKAACPVALPGSSRARFNPKLGNMGLQRVVLFRKQQHTPALQEIFTAGVVEGCYDGHIRTRKIICSTEPQLLKLAIKL